MVLQQPWLHTGHAEGEMVIQPAWGGGVHRPQLPRTASSGLRVPGSLHDTTASQSLSFRTSVSFSEGVIVTEI